jgi:hypothetical protein
MVAAARFVARPGNWTVEPNAAFSAESGGSR